MSALRRSARLAALLLILLGVGAWITWESGQFRSAPADEPDAKPNAEPDENRSKSSALPPAALSLELETLEQRALPKFQAAIFGQMMIAPIAVPSATPSPPPAPPAPPPFPYSYLGQYRDAEGFLVFYLGKGDQVILAKPGTPIDERYQLAPDTRHGLMFTETGTKHTHTIPIESTAP